MNGRFLFLGTGASAGVPLIGCHCAVCRSADPRNRRLRCAGLVRIKDKQLLIDAGPDLRQQALLHRIEKIDGLLLTHTHYDHIAGIDDLRIFNHRMQRPMPCLLSPESWDDLKRRYYYFFKDKEDSAAETAQFACQVVEDGTTHFEGIEVGVMSYYQGPMRVNGFRFGNFAYVSDIRRYEDKLFASLSGVQQLAISALRSETSKMHFSVDEAVAFARQVGARQTWLTHIAHHLDHGAGERLLPPDIRIGYDGLEIEFTY